MKPIGVSGQSAAKTLAILAIATLVGCAPKSSSLGNGLVEADKRCNAVQWQFLGGWAECLHGEERRVWASIDPPTLPLFEEVAERRADLAAQFDRGTLSADDFKTGMERAKAKLREQMTEFQQRQLQQEEATQSERAALLSGIFDVIGAVVRVAVEVAAAYGEARYGYAASPNLTASSPRPLPAPNFEIDRWDCQYSASKLPGFPGGYQCLGFRYK